MGDAIGCDDFLHHVAGAGAILRLRIHQLLLELRDHAIGEFTGPLEFALALRDRKFVPGFVQLALEVCGKAQLLLFRLPAGRQGVGFLLKRGQFGVEPGQPVGRGRIGFLLQRLTLDLQLHDAPIEFVEFLRLAVHLHAQPRCRLVHQVDGLVGQKPVGDVAVRQGRCRDQRRIRDPHLVMLLVFFLQPAQDRDRVLDIGLVDHDRLEAPGERRILLDMLAVFVERRRPDAMQLAARKRRLQQVGGIHRAIGLAGTDQRMHLVDEQDDLAAFGLDLVEHGLQALLELAAILCTGNQRAHIERHQLLVLQALRHIAVDDAQSKTFCDRRLADAGFTDQDRVVLGPARQDLDRATDLVVAADHRIEATFAGLLGQVARIFLQRVEAGLGIGAVGGAALADLVDHLVQRIRRHATLLERGRCRGGGFDRKRLQQALDRDEAVTGLLCRIFRRRKHLGERLGQIDLSIAAGHLGKLGQSRIIGDPHRLGIATGTIDQRGGHALLVVEQNLQHMLRRELLVPFRQGMGLRGLQKTAHAFGIFLDIHRHSPLSPPCPHSAQVGWCG